LVSFPVRAAFLPFKGLVVAILFLGPMGCEDPDLSIPSAGEVEARYEFHGPIHAEIRGNVAQVTVEIPPSEIERGGALWAKSVPYIFLFSRGTLELFEDHPGLAGVRFVARAPDDALIAQALLERGALTPATWPRALSIAGTARKEGTDSPARMQDLVHWGEDHTDFEYNPRYAPG